jgi:hypothetical protein
MTGSFLCPAAPALPHTDRVPAELPETAWMAPCSTPGEAQTFQISRRQLFSHLRRRASAGKAPDPEGRTRQRQAASRPRAGARPAAQWAFSLTIFITQRDGVYRRSPMQADSLGVSGLAVAVGRGACHVASERPAADAGSRLACGLRGQRALEEIRSRIGTAASRDAVIGLEQGRISRSWQPDSTT